MKKIAILFLIYSSGYSQNEVSNLITLADTLCINITPKEQLSGVIKFKKRTIGSFGNTVYNYKEKIIKSEYTEYSENRNIKNTEYELYFQFYYRGKEPIFLKIDIKNKDKSGKEEELYLELNKDEINDTREIKNIFLLDLRNTIKKALALAKK